jgi:hypothetical protein
MLRKYIYTGGDPLNYIDPRGRSAEEDYGTREQDSAAPVHFSRHYRYLRSHRGQTAQSICARYQAIGGLSSNYRPP